MLVDMAARQTILQGRGFCGGRLSGGPLPGAHLSENEAAQTVNMRSPEYQGDSLTISAFSSSDSGISNALSRSSSSSERSGESAEHLSLRSTFNRSGRADKRADRGSSKAREKVHRQESAANPRFIAVIDSDVPEGIDIRSFEDRLKSEMGPKVKIQNRNDIAVLPGRIPSMSELDGLFGRIVNDSTIPWEYVTDGCFARSHVTCDRLLREGWNCAKIFVMADMPENDSSSDGGPDYHLRAQNRYTKGEWQYHVATLIFAKDEGTGKVDGYMLDGSIDSSRPLRPSEWIRSFWNQGTPIRLDTTLPDTYCSPNESESDEPHEFFRPEFDKFLEYAVKTNEKYAAALEEIRSNIKSCPAE